MAYGDLPHAAAGLKWGRTLWLAALAGGPFEYTGRELRDAHFDLKIPPEVFDEVAAELANALDEFKVPEREKEGSPQASLGEAESRPVPSRGLSIGAAGVEPGVIRTANSIQGLLNTTRRRWWPPRADAKRSRDAAKLISP